VEKLSFIDGRNMEKEKLVISLMVIIDKSGDLKLELNGLRLYTY